jgi:hypothetical protein
VSEAQVQTEATQGAQASGQPMDLHVPVHRLLAFAAGRLAPGIEAVGDRLLEALRDGREVLLVAGDQRRVGLGGEVVGKVKGAGSQGGHVISSDLTFVTLDPNFGAHERGWTLLHRRKGSHLQPLRAARCLDRRDEPGGHDEQRSA